MGAIKQGTYEYLYCLIEANMFICKTTTFTCKHVILSGIVSDNAIKLLVKK